jgi:hypothetical protein
MAIIAATEKGMPPKRPGAASPGWKPGATASSSISRHRRQDGISFPPSGCALGGGLVPAPGYRSEALFASTLPRFCLLSSLSGSVNRFL